MSAEQPAWITSYSCFGGDDCLASTHGEWCPKWVEPPQDAATAAATKERSED